MAVTVCLFSAHNQAVFVTTCTQYSPLMPSRASSLLCSAITPAWNCSDQPRDEASSILRNRLLTGLCNVTVSGCLLCRRFAGYLRQHCMRSSKAEDKRMQPYSSTNKRRLSPNSQPKNSTCALYEYSKCTCGQNLLSF